MRLDGWEQRLLAIIENPGAFEWGTNDCCMFAVRCVEAITGVDHGKKYRGYKTEKGALSRLAKHGGTEGIATACLGEPKNPKLAKRGDVVSHKNDLGVALGVCVGDKIAAISDNGIVLVSMRDAMNAWSV